MGAPRPSDWFQWAPGYKERDILLSFPSASGKTRKNPGHGADGELALDLNEDEGPEMLSFLTLLRPGTGGSQRSGGYSPLDIKLQLCSHWSTERNQLHKGRLKG